MSLELADNPNFSNSLDSSINFSDKISPLSEAFRRSNVICQQVYTKDIENLPGESAASSIISRHISSYETKFQDTVRRLCTWRDLMARIHDENIKYVLSDQAIVILAEYTPYDPVDVCNVVLQTDESDALLNSCISAPSPIVCSHMEDLCYVLQNDIASVEDIFQYSLTKCLGRKGSCPLSVFNYSLLAKSNLKQVNKFVSKQNGGRQSKRYSRRASRRDQFVQKFSCKSPVYHNCRIYADDGRLLCYCDRRKLEWYLRRDLAELVEEDPPGIKLKFEPKGRPEDEDNDFYIQTKKNICVGCGEQNHYLRYRIIPSCYRIHFPEHLKSHRSHDIVLLCVDCHEIAHAAAEKYKRRIAVELGIPLFIQKVVDSIPSEVALGSSTSRVDQEGVSPLQLRTAAMALLRHGPSMPSKRRDELIQTVMKYYGGRVITEEDLEKALLVGMSPHERRRLEKKKGVSLKHSGHLNKGFKENGRDCLTTAVVTYTDTVDDKVGIPNQISVTNGKCDGEVDSNGMLSETNKYSESGETGTLDKADKFGVQSSSPKSVGFSYPTLEGTVSPKHNSKLSLLGHGPHGKQVVDHLLKEYGESGISVFCQQWRRVFVEAVHPRFLAPGWDVKHSGRRDFGEFSVYNPSKRSAEATNS
uniref:HRDC domain-containing protein n=1 Tax=Kalanchoe fedtschenkoi TaxID=63787 RepID=A0A7N0TFL9_KALFE